MTLSGAYLGELVANKHLFNAVSMVLLYAFTLLMLRLFRGQFDGLTGDTLGALGELSENVFLFAVVIWSGLYI
jgi:cobalamin synthase